MNIFIGIILFIWFWLMLNFLIETFQLFVNLKRKKFWIQQEEEQKAQLKEINKYNDLLDYLKAHKEDITFNSPSFVRVKYFQIERINNSSFYLNSCFYIDPAKYKHIQKEILKYLEDVLYGVKEKKK